MTHITDFHEQGLSLVLEQVLCSLKVLKLEYDWLLAEILFLKVLKKTDKLNKSYNKKREIYQKFVKMSHFNLVILEKP